VSHLRIYGVPSKTARRERLMMREFATAIAWLMPIHTWRRLQGQFVSDDREARGIDAAIRFEFRGTH
jgi:hypothetical protein